MKRIHYAEDSIVTGDEIAGAVLDLAQVLAVTGAAETVDIPALADDQTIGRVQLLVGPASQMSVSEEHTGAAEIQDADLVARLRTRAAHRHQPAPVFSDDDVSVPGVES